MGFFFFGKFVYLYMNRIQKYLFIALILGNIAFAGLFLWQSYRANKAEIQLKTAETVIKKYIK